MEKLDHDIEKMFEQEQDFLQQEAEDKDSFYWDLEQLMEKYDIKDQDKLNIVLEILELYKIVPDHSTKDILETIKEIKSNNQLKKYNLEWLIPKNIPNVKHTRNK